MLRTVEEETFRSVSAVSGNLARLAYLISLQTEPGVYSHWGLAHEYGREAVSEAFKRTHRVILDTVLQMDLCELDGELRMHADNSGQSSSECLRRLLSSPALNPFTSNKHLQAHMSYVFESLRALARRSD